MSLFINLIKEMLPPIFIRIIRQVLIKKNIYEGNYTNWNEANRFSTGYDSHTILTKVLNSTVKVIEGKAIYERDSILFDEIQYSWPVTAALMRAAAKNSGQLCVLDFGGALGSCYFQNKKFLDSLGKVSWNIVEQNNFVEAGRSYVENDVVKFYDSIDEALNHVRPNCILFSSVIQYLPDMQQLLKVVNKMSAGTLIFDKTPFVEGESNIICIQRVPSEIYEASYPLYLLSKEKFLMHLKDWSLLESFSCPEGRMKTSTGIEFEFLGFIFERENV